MTKFTPDSLLTSPGSLIAALPAILGFVPVRSLVLVTLDDGEMGAVMRVDITDKLHLQVGQLARTAAAGQPDAVIAVFVDATGAGCPACNDDFAHVVGLLEAVLESYGIAVYAGHVVDRIEAGGRWHCFDGCGAGGAVDDPATSPVAAAAVLDGRRLYGDRNELLALTAVDVERCQLVGKIIDQRALLRAEAVGVDAQSRARCDVHSARTAAARLAAGEPLRDDEIADIGCALVDPRVRDTLYALAVGEDAAEAEMLWTELSRTLPPPWRIEALVLLAFTAYARGDGPIAGMSLEAALRVNPAHRMANMLDLALQSAMHPETIRELAETGYRLARKYGIALPPERPFDQRAG